MAPNPSTQLPWMMKHLNFMLLSWHQHRGIVACNYSRLPTLRGMLTRIAIPGLPPGNRDPDQGGNFHLAQYGVLVEASDDMAIVWRGSDWFNGPGTVSSGSGCERLRDGMALAMTATPSRTTTAPSIQPHHQHPIYYQSTSDTPSTKVRVPHCFHYRC